jgi:D-glycero-alpha-D-manno-heptose-7-phosphate kinase
MRVDLAGGTLDIYPLYVFEGGAYTVNAAIGIRSRVVLETRNDHKIIIYSRDLDMEFSAPNVDELRPEGPLDLIARTVKYYRPAAGLTVTTENNIPKGSGLGASSTLLMALSHALIRLSGQRPDKEKVIDIGANIEAQSIKVPTGKQDYYPASYGWINAIWFGIDGVKRSSIDVPKGFIQELEERTVLSFVGAPRFSGATNWNMMKAYIDNQRQTVANIRRIKQTALKIKGVLEQGCFHALARLLREEWRNRKNLAPGVTNPQIDGVMAAIEKEGALASKLCGAGGGGCMVTLTRKGAKVRVERYLQKAGILVLPFKIERRGAIVSPAPSDRSGSD